VTSGIIGFVLGLLVALLTARVIVARIVARQRSAERRARAAERMAELGAMTSGLAHEIRNPLSTIGLNAQLLAEGLDELDCGEEPRARLARRLGTLNREIDRLRGILEDFLQYAGQIHLAPAPTDLNELTDELIDFFAPQAEQQGIRLRAELYHEPLIAPLDAKLVKQAVLNLMLNAAQAMADQPPPRELILRTRPDTDAGAIPVVVLDVIDTGPGIDTQTRAKLFEPYFSTKPTGTGLGLPTTRRIVEAHDGHIDLHTDPGQGSDFALVFPASNRAPSPT